MDIKELLEKASKYDKLSFMNKIMSFNKWLKTKEYTVVDNAISPIDEILLDEINKIGKSSGSSNLEINNTETISLPNKFNIHTGDSVVIDSTTEKENVINEYSGFVITTTEGLSITTDNDAKVYYNLTLSGTPAGNYIYSIYGNKKIGYWVSVSIFF